MGVVYHDVVRNREGLILFEGRPFEMERHLRMRLKLHRIETGMKVGVASTGKILTVEEYLSRSTEMMRGQEVLKRDVVRNHVDDNVFEGSPEEVFKWMREVEPHSLETLRVIIGRTGEELLGEDYLTRKRYEAVLDLVAEAMVKQDAATYHRAQSRVDGLAGEISKKIVDLFN